LIWEEKPSGVLSCDEWLLRSMERQSLVEEKTSVVVNECGDMECNECEEGGNRWRSEVLLSRKEVIYGWGFLLVTPFLDFRPMRKGLDARVQVFQRDPGSGGRKVTCKLKLVPAFLVTRATTHVYLIIWIFYGLDTIYYTSIPFSLWMNSTWRGRGRGRVVWLITHTIIRISRVCLGQVDAFLEEYEQISGVIMTKSRSADCHQRRLAQRKHSILGRDRQGTTNHTWWGETLVFHQISTGWVVYDMMGLYIETNCCILEIRFV